LLNKRRYSDGEGHFVEVQLERERAQILFKNGIQSFYIEPEQSVSRFDVAGL
jgi:hypothetical protein